MTEEQKAAVDLITSDANDGRQRGACIVTDRSAIRTLLAMVQPSPAQVALDDIAKERQRQLGDEGYTLEHDDGHDKGEIANAAADWATTGAHPVSSSWAANKGKHPRRRQLIIAGALIVAEIERLDRARGREIGGDG